MIVSVDWWVPGTTVFTKTRDRVPPSRTADHAQSLGNVYIESRVALTCTYTFLSDRVSEGLVGTTDRGSAGPSVVVCVIVGRAESKTEVGEIISKGLA